MLRVRASVWAATVRLWIETARCHWVLTGVSLGVATLLAVAGLAEVGVRPPTAGEAPFEAAGIELPDPSSGDDGQATTGSSQADRHGHGTRDAPVGTGGGPSIYAGIGSSLGPEVSGGVQSGRRQSGDGRGAGHGAAKHGLAGRKRILHGVSDTSDTSDFHGFAKQVGAHPAVLEDFYHWDTPLTTGALQRWQQTRTRGVLSLSTAPGDGPELISPREIAQGKDDHYLVRLNHSIAASKQFVYIRLFPEMNGCWNPYSAYRKDGSQRGRKHTTKSFRRAWQRVVLIVRGGKRRAINHELQRRHMPRILRASSNHDPIYKPQGVHRRLPQPQVSFMWTPQATSAPNVPGNKAGAYWPGRRFVDWVGTDTYSAYARPLPQLESFYRHWKGYPFVIGEYSPWNRDTSGRFTKRLFRWAERHDRVRMMIYYRSVHAGTKYDISRWPKALGVLRHELEKPLFAPYASGARH